LQSLLMAIVVLALIIISSPIQIWSATPRVFLKRDL
jgi:hypothetical protein